MTTPRQKAEERPISFVLHNMAFDAPPVEVKLVIRPEDLTRAESSRTSVVQTLGGAWADSFGPGIPTVQISGHTGWGAGGRQNGFEAFQELHDTVFSQWHSLRAFAAESGRDPDLVRLIFADYLDDFVWVVSPQQFVLRRNRSRPLLSQYQINMTWLSDDVAETIDQLRALKSSPASLSDIEESGLESMLKSFEKIADFVASGVSSFLGPIRAAFDKLCSLTATALSAVQRVIKAGMGIVNAFTSGLLGIAASLTRAAANVTHIVRSITSLPQQIAAKFQRVASAFENAFCVIRNIFKRRQFLPNFDALYGASSCSSTAGGKPISRYDTENPFPALYPVQTSSVRVSSTASAALNRMAGADPVLNRPGLSQVSADVAAIGNGVSITA